MAAAFALALLVLIAQAGYVFAGSQVASNKNHDADRAISTALAHLDGMKDSFDNIGTNFQWLSATNVNPQQIQPQADQFVQTWQANRKAIRSDDDALRGSQQQLGDRAWLTLPSHSHLSQEAARLAHARKALSEAGVLADDLQKDGQFLQKFAAAAVDLSDAATAVKANNAQAYGADLSKLVADAGAALQLADSPGLPPEVHSLATALSTFAKDTRTEVLQLAAGTTTKADATKVLNSDLAALSAVSVDQVPAEVDTFFKTRVDEYRAEEGAASH